MDEDDRQEPDDPPRSEEMQRLYTELFERLGALVDDGVDIDDLRRALQGSFMLTASPEQRSGWDKLRLEVDAYLRARGDRDVASALQTPEGFVPSPELGKSDDDDSR